MSEIAEWFTAIGTVLTAIVAVFVAFLPSLKKWYNRPKFKIEFENKEPFCRHTLTWFGVVKDGRTNHPVSTYWIRLRVRNVGHSVARNCKGKLVRIADAMTKEDRKDFDPVVLHWVGEIDKPIDINKSEFEYLDVVYNRTDDPKTFNIRCEEKEFERAINLTPERKDYILQIVLYGENVEPLQKSFYLKNHEEYDKIKLSLSEEK
jgi:hypothetical protein